MPNLKKRYQQHLVDAVVSKIEMIEAELGNQFGFEVMRNGETTLVSAKHWPHLPDQIPFHRVFHYVAPEDTEPDPILSRCIEGNLDAVFEILPGPHRARTEALLKRYHFTPKWEIPWLHIRTNDLNDADYKQVSVRKIQNHEMDLFATLFVQGYEYGKANAEPWYTFAKYGYAGQDFHCFLAKVKEVPIAIGALYIQDSIAALDGAATIPAHRGLGGQKALLAGRIQYANSGIFQHGQIWG